MASIADGNDRFRTVVYGFAATATFAFLAWVATSVNAMSERLVTIEVTMAQNREERLEQIQDLRERIRRLEDIVERIPPEEWR